MKKSLIILACFFCCKNLLSQQIITSRVTKVAKYIDSTQTWIGLSKVKEKAVFIFPENEHCFFHKTNDKLHKYIIIEKDTSDNSIIYTIKSMDRDLYLFSKDNRMCTFLYLINNAKHVTSYSHLRFKKQKTRN